MSYTAASSFGIASSDHSSPVAARMRSKQYCRAASMPSPSRSNFTSPIHAASSLSHWMTVRFSMRACSIGTTSPTGRSVSTMPPEWMPRWRGAFMSAPAYSSTRSGMSWAPGTGPSHRSTCFDQASCWPGE